MANSARMHSVDKRFSALNQEEEKLLLGKCWHEKGMDRKLFRYRWSLHYTLNLRKLMSSHSMPTRFSQMDRSKVSAEECSTHNLSLKMFMYFGEETLRLCSPLNPKSLDGIDLLPMSYILYKNVHRNLDNTHLDVWTDSDVAALVTRTSNFGLGGGSGSGASSSSSSATANTRPPSSDMDAFLADEESGRGNPQTQASDDDNYLQNLRSVFEQLSDKSTVVEPFMGIGPEAPLVYIFAEIVRTDASKVNLSQHRGRYEAYMDRNGVVHNGNMSELYRLLTLYKSKMKNQEGMEMCEEAMKWLSRMFSHVGETPCPKGVTPYSLENEEEPVDSITFSIFFNNMIDVGHILEDLLAENNILKMSVSGSGASALSAKILEEQRRVSQRSQNKSNDAISNEARQAIRQVGEASGEVSEETVGQFTDLLKSLQRSKRQQGGKSHPGREAALGKGKQRQEKIINNIAHGVWSVDTSKWADIVGMYVDSGVVQNLKLTGSRSIHQVRNLYSPFHPLNVFSFENAMLNRSPDCNPAQSLQAYTKFMEVASVNATDPRVLEGYMYTDKVRTLDGFECFLYTTDNVYRYHPDALSVLNFTDLPLPTCLMETRHPIVERSKELVSSAGDIINNYPSYRPRHDLEKVDDEGRCDLNFASAEAYGVDEEELERRRQATIYFSAVDKLYEIRKNMLSTHMANQSTALALPSSANPAAMESDSNDPDDRQFTASNRYADVLPLERLNSNIQRFDLKKLDSTVYNMLIAMTPALTASAPGAYSTAVMQVEQMKALSMIVQRAIKTMPDVGRRAALLHAHQNFVMKTFNNVLDPYLPNQEALVAIFHAIKNRKVHSAEGRPFIRLADDNLPAYANLLIAMQHLNQFISNAADPHTLLFIYLASMSSTDWGKNLKLKVMEASDGEKSKSYRANQVHKEMRVHGPACDGNDGVCGQNSSEQRVEQMLGGKNLDAMSTSRNRTYTSAMAGTSGGFPDDFMHIIDEEVTLMSFLPHGSNDHGSGSSDTHLSTNSLNKSVATSCYVEVFHLSFNEKGERITTKTTRVERASSHEIGNKPVGGIMEDSFVTRRIFIQHNNTCAGEKNNVTHTMIAESFRKETADMEDYVDVFAGEEEETYYQLCKQLREDFKVTPEQLKQMYNEFHCFMTESNIMVQMGACPPIGHIVGHIILDAIDKELINAGFSGFRPRQVSQIIMFSAILCMLNIYGTEIVFPGGRFFGRDFPPERMIEFMGMMYLQPAHVITTLGFMVPYFTIHSRKELREAFVFETELRMNKAGENFNLSYISDKREYQAVVDTRKLSIASRKNKQGESASSSSETTNDRPTPGPGASNAQKHKNSARIYADESDEEMEEVSDKNEVMDEDEAAMKYLEQKARGVDVRPPSSRSITSLSKGDEENGSSEADSSFLDFPSKEVYIGRKHINAIFPKSSSGLAKYGIGGTSSKKISTTKASNNNNSRGGSKNAAGKPTDDSDDNFDGIADGLAMNVPYFVKFDPSDYELDYVKLPYCGQQESIASAIVTTMNNMKIKDVPSVRIVEDVMLGLSKMLITSHPVRIKADLSGLKHGKVRITDLVELDEDQKKMKFNILRRRGTTYQVSTAFLMHDVPMIDVVLKALQKMFNNINEPVKRYLWTAESRGELFYYRTIDLGRGIKPGYGDHQEPDLNIKSNPDAYKRMKIPNFGKMPDDMKDLLNGNRMYKLSREDEEDLMNKLSLFLRGPEFRNMRDNSRRMHEEFDELNQGSGSGAFRPTSKESRMAFDEVLADDDENLYFSVKAGRSHLSDADRQRCEKESKEFALLIAALNRLRNSSDYIQLNSSLEHYGMMAHQASINWSPNPVTTHHVKFAVEHFDEWLRRANSGMTADQVDEQMTIEEKQLFGRWDRYGALINAEIPASIKRNDKDQIMADTEMSVVESDEEMDGDSDDDDDADGGDDNRQEEKSEESNSTATRTSENSAEEEEEQDSLGELLDDLEKTDISRKKQEEDEEDCVVVPDSEGITPHFVQILATPDVIDVGNRKKFRFKISGCAPAFVRIPKRFKSMRGTAYLPWEKRLREIPHNITKIKVYVDRYDNEGTYDYGDDESDCYSDVGSPIGSDRSFGGNNSYKDFDSSPTASPSFASLSQSSAQYNNEKSPIRANNTSMVDDGDNETETEREISLMKNLERSKTKAVSISDSRSVLVTPPDMIGDVQMIAESYVVDNPYFEDTEDRGINPFDNPVEAPIFCVVMPHTIVDSVTGKHDKLPRRLLHKMLYHNSQAFWQVRMCRANRAEKKTDYPTYLLKKKDPVDEALKLLGKCESYVQDPFDPEPNFSPLTEKAVRLIENTRNNLQHVGSKRKSSASSKSRSNKKQKKRTKPISRNRTAAPLSYNVPPTNIPTNFTTLAKPVLVGVVNTGSAKSSLQRQVMLNNSDVGRKTLELGGANGRMY